MIIIIICKLLPLNLLSILQQEGILGSVYTTSTGQISSVIGISINEDLVILLGWLPMNMILITGILCFVGDNSLDEVFSISLSPCI